MTTILFLTLIGCNIYLIVRNNAVKDFHMNLTDIISAKCTREINAGNLEAALLPWDLMEILPSYNRMVFSFKPLILEKYFKEKDIEYLLS